MTDAASLITEIQSLFDQAAFKRAEQACRDAGEAARADPRIGVLHARALERMGRRGEAIQVLRKLIADAPGDADACYHLGRLLIETDRLEIAAGDIRKPFAFKLEWCEIAYPNRTRYPASLVPEGFQMLQTCLQLDSSRADAAIAMALTLFDIPERRKDAVPMIQQIVAAAPQLVAGHFGMGRLALWQGAVEIAAAAFAHVTQAEPAYPQARAYLALATFGQQGGETVPAEIALQDAEGHAQIASAIAEVLANPNIRPALRNILGLLAGAYARHLAGLAEEAARSRGAYIEAARLIDAALRLSGSSYEICMAIGHLMFAANLAEYAEVAFHNARAHAPDSEAPAKMLETIARGKGASPQYGGIIGPSPPPSYSGLNVHMSAEDVLQFGEASCKDLDLQKAVRLLRVGTQNHPGNAEIQLRLSEALAYQGLIDEALAPAERALELDPDNGWMAAHLGALYRCKGRLGESWQLLEQRFRYARPDSRSELPALPRWEGQSLDAGKLLIWREEGFGDEIRFASCLTDAIAEVGIDNIIWECSPRLLGLFRRSFPGLDVGPEDLAQPDHASAQYHLPIMSLPGRYRNELGDFPASGAYLAADPARVEKWKQRLGQLSDAPKIGICWRSLNNSWRKRPQSNTLADWAPVLAGSEYSFVNLQAEDCADEIAWAEAEYGCTIYSFDDLDLKNDAEETAALMTALDALVSCRCWIITFAGALGRPVFNFSGPYNNWMSDLDHDPWAPTTLTFYRQFGEPWQPCMRAVAAALESALPIGSGR